jgi:ferric enterobactin receptor
MPGVSASTELSAGLYVRGGTPDQNLILFDGFTVYKVDHFFGIFSAFNAGAVENMTMFKGGFDSKYGGRISSVVDLAGKNGNKGEIEAGGGLSLLSYNAYVDGPLGKKGTFMLAARKSYQSPFSSKIRDNYSTANSGPGGWGLGGNATSSQPGSSFYDVKARVTYAAGAKDNLVASLYYGMDDFDNSRSLNLPSFGSSQDRTLSGGITDLAHWGNAGASLSWQRNWTRTYTAWDINSSVEQQNCFNPSQATLKRAAGRFNSIPEQKNPAQSDRGFLGSAPRSGFCVKRSPVTISAGGGGGVGRFTGMGQIVSKLLLYRNSPVFVCVLLIVNLGGARTFAGTR